MAGGGSYYSSIDYTVFSVAVTTLWLLLGVEKVRSFLDKITDEFYAHVLNFLWRELATLGIVELGVFLLHEHYLDFDITHEKVFADVHFMFFFTAIVNAVLTVVLHACTMRYAQEKWLTTEAQNINQYVLLRKNLRDTRDELRDKNPMLLDCYMNGDAVWMNIFKVYFYKFRTWDLAARYERLAEQRRFHELRIHMIEVNKLPKKFPLAKYLILCLREVFLHQVHIHLLAWLALMLFVEVLYFSMGLVLFACESDGDKYYCNTVVGDSLTTIFVVVCGAAVMITVMTYIKMERNFNFIIHQPESIGARLPKDPDQQAIFADSGHHSTEYLAVQKGLFWFSHPSVVTGIFQLIQLGYAIGSSCIYIFRDEIYYDDVGSLFLVFIISSYTAVLYFMVLALPRFTIVTSLGQMTRNSHLMQVSADMTLKKAFRDKMAALEASKESERKSKSSVLRSSSDHEFDNKHRFEFMSIDELLQRKDELNLDLSEEKPASTRRRSRLRKSSSEGVNAMRSLGLANSEPLESNTTLSKDDLSIKSGLTDKRSRRRKARMRSMSAPTDIAQMQALTNMEDTRSRKTLPSNPAGSSLPVLVESIPAFNPITTKDVQTTSSSANDSLADSIFQKSEKVLQPVKEVTRPQDDHNSNGGELSKEEGRNGEDFLTTRAKLQNLLSSQSYRASSFMLFTMPAFFLLGMRVEIQLISDDELVDTENTFHFSLTESFWIMFSVLCAFILEGLLTVFMFRNSEKVGLIYTGIIGAVNGAICLVLLIIAELDRSDGRFGSRKSGGLGLIEPFVALLLFRDMRWYFSDLLIGGKTSDHDISLTEHSTHAYELKQSAKDIENETILLWSRAIQNYPDIVRDHGEFSSELLKAMLGVSMPSTPLSNTLPKSETRPSRVKTDSSLSVFEDDFDIIEPSFPASVLLQPMHRGEIRLAGLIDTWTVADIVITKHELLCFDCFDEEGHDLGWIDDGVTKPTSPRTVKGFQKRKSAHDNLLLTEGGQGMSLSEVSSGRKIISRVSLNNVESVKVQRHVHKKNAICDVSVHGTHDVVRSEYWKHDEDPNVSFPLAPSNRHDSHNVISELNKCWEDVEDDQLFIRCNQGVLLIRFIGDLELAEGRELMLPSAGLETTIAIRWCKEISHIVEGALTENDEQILEIVDDSLAGMKKLKKNFTKGNLRRITSFSYGRSDD